MCLFLRAFPFMRLQEKRSCHLISRSSRLTFDVMQETSCEREISVQVSNTAVSDCSDNCKKRTQDMIETHEILYSQKRTEEEDFQLSRHARQDKRTKCLRCCLLRMSQEFTKEFKTQWQGISVKYKYHLFQMPFLPIIKGCFLFLKRRLFEKKKRTPERRTEQQKPRHAKEAFLQSNRRLRHHCLFNIIMFMKRGDHFKNEERQPERVKRNKMESTYMHLSQNCQP